MNEHIDLDGLTRKTRRLEFEDGLNDLQNGLVFLILGSMASLFMSTAGITLYMRAFLSHPDLTTIALLGLIPLFILITFGMRRIIVHYRKSVLWRHLGEVEPFRWQVDRRVSILATAIWLVVVVVGLVLVVGDPTDLDADMRVIIAAGGIATGVIYFALGQSLAMARYRWVGVVGSVFSAALIFTPIGASLSWLVFGLGWMGILLVSGVTAFRHTRTRLREGEA